MDKNNSSYVKEIATSSVIGGVSAPIVTTAVIKVVGFSTVGIVKGTIAAKIMSATAIANSGAVSSGGLVATCQSIGVVGLSATGIGIAVGTGAVVCVGGYKYVKSKL